MRIPPAARAPIDPARQERIAAVFAHVLYPRAMAATARDVGTMQAGVGYLMIASGLAAAGAVVWNELHGSMHISELDVVMMGMVGVWTLIGVALAAAAHAALRAAGAPLRAVPAKVLVVGTLSDDQVLVTLAPVGRRRWLRAHAPRALGERLVAYRRGVAFVERGVLLDFVTVDG
jgi:hypothetical protein